MIEIGFYSEMQSVGSCIVANEPPRVVSIGYIRRGNIQFIGSVADLNWGPCVSFRK